MNPLLSTTASAPPQQIACATCGDMGFVLPAFQYREGIPAGVLYRDGKPCTCAAGREFERYQAEWNKPILMRAPLPHNEEPRPVKAARECNVCGDMGVFCDGQVYQWCDCAYATDLRCSVPNYLDLVNGGSTRPRNSPPIPNTEALKYQQARNHKSRCKGPNCQVCKILGVTE